MKYPKCNKEIKKIRWELVHTFHRAGPDTEYMDYDRTTYECMDDDLWLITEIPEKIQIQQKTD